MEQPVDTSGRTTITHPPQTYVFDGLAGVVPRRLESLGRTYSWAEDRLEKELPDEQEHHLERELAFWENAFPQAVRVTRLLISSGLSARDLLRVPWQQIRLSPEPATCDRLQLLDASVDWARARAGSKARKWQLVHLGRAGSYWYWLSAPRDRTTPSRSRRFKGGIRPEGGVTLNDVRQEGIIALCEAAGAWRAQGPFRAYAQVAITNHLHSFLQGETDYFSPPWPEWYPPPVPHRATGERAVGRCRRADSGKMAGKPAREPACQPAGHTLRIHRLRALAQALAELDPLERRVIELRHFVGLTVREAASNMRRPQGEVRHLESHALARVRRALTDRGWDTGDTQPEDVLPCGGGKRRGPRPSLSQYDEQPSELSLAHVAAVYGGH